MDHLRFGIINLLRAQWDALQPISDVNSHRLAEKFRLEWNYNSNHLEGNTLTYTETQLLLVFGKTAGIHQLREYQEMRAHDVAIKMVQEWAQDKTIDLTEADIRNLNKVILVEPFWKEAITPDGQSTQREIKVGEYKEYPNSVRLSNGELFHYASPLETPRLMAELMEWYRKNTSELHPLILASELHYRFICIHPFDDGNGRIARLLVNYVLIKNGYPPIVIKSSDKQGYLTALQYADSGDMDAFYDYMAVQLGWSLDIAVKAGSGESIDEPGDIDKKISVLQSEIANVNVDDDAQWHLDKPTLLKIFDSWVAELIKGWMTEIKKFDAFFTKPVHHITVMSGTRRRVGGGSSVSLNDLNKADNDKLIAELRQMIDQHMNLLSEVSIILSATYGTFKKGALKNPFGCNYSVEIYFDYLTYQIHSREFMKEVHPPQIINQLKETLEQHPAIPSAYFDSMGRYHFDVEKTGDGKLVVNKEIEIVSYYSREDILQERILDGGLIRFKDQRLLHKPFFKSEIDELCTKEANTIYAHIDYYTKKHKLR